MRKLWKKTKEKAGKVLLKTILLSMSIMGVCQHDVLAAAGGDGFTSVTNAINVLKTGLFALIGGVGVIILGKNIMEAATAFQQQDSAGLNNAIKGIIAGGLMAAVGSIVTAMGFA